MFLLAGCVLLIWPMLSGLVHIRFRIPDTQTLATKLIALMAFDRDEEGDLQPAFEPREMRDEGTAKRNALQLKNDHAGVLARVRSADLARGEIGEPEVLAQYGDVPDMV